MFKVGDLVRSLKRKDGLEYYSVTNSGVVCKVICVEGDYMGVRIDDNAVDIDFWVKCSTFKLETVDLENK